MEFQYRYFGQSQAYSDSNNTDLSFAPDTLREPAYFVADLGKHLPFREAISALNSVVISDLNAKPRDLTEYMAWREREEPAMLAEYLSTQNDIAEQIRPIREELTQLNLEINTHLKPYFQAESKYFNYLYKTDYNAWYVLDPVITVHPDQVFFECFSQDESSYGRLSCSHNIFDNISDCTYGTTNIDYSAQLYQEFQKIRDYRRTQLKIDPSGFQIKTDHSDQFTERKIDLPDSWIRGFLQVNSALTLPTLEFDLHPMDVHNLCFLLRRQKERVGPRSLRIQLKPGQPVKISVEPWNHILNCPRSIYHGNEETEIRIWGRRRLFILERLIPVTKKFTVRLLGTGLPSFWIADMGDLQFTLGLSGWTANDWSKAGNFDLMAPRGEIDNDTAHSVITELQKQWQCSSANLAKTLQLDETMVKTALSLYAQHGRVLYDTEADVYRLRELSREPFPMGKLRFDNPREARAENFVTADLVSLSRVETQAEFTKFEGHVIDNSQKQLVKIYIDRDERLFKAHCSCSFFIHNKLFKGPCEHMIALRKAAAQKGNKNNE
jgi:hypothetical protein